MLFHDVSEHLGAIEFRSHHTPICVQSIDAHGKVQQFLITTVAVAAACITHNNSFLYRDRNIFSVTHPKR